MIQAYLIVAVAVVGAVLSAFHQRVGAYVVDDADAMLTPMLSMAGTRPLLKRPGLGRWSRFRIYALPFAGGHAANGVLEMANVRWGCIGDIYPAVATSSSWARMHADDQHGSRLAGAELARSRKGSIIQTSVSSEINAHPLLHTNCCD